MLAVSCYGKSYYANLKPPNCVYFRKNIMILLQIYVFIGRNGVFEVYLYINKAYMLYTLQLR